MAYTLISETILLLFLGVSAFMDRYTRSISVPVAAAVFAAGLALNLASGEHVWWQLLAGCGPGLMLLVVARLSNQAIGYGDGLIFTAAGPYLGIVNSLFLLFISLTMAALFAVPALLLKKKRLNSTIAFVPFILCGYIFLLLLAAL